MMTTAMAAPENSKLVIKIIKKNNNCFVVFSTTTLLLCCTCGKNFSRILRYSLPNENKKFPNLKALMWPHNSKFFILDIKINYFTSTAGTPTNPLEAYFVNNIESEQDGIKIYYKICKFEQMFIFKSTFLSCSCHCSLTSTISLLTLCI